MTMKCVSVVQPWASLIVFGVRTRMARRWSTRHRDLLAIHASGTFPVIGREMCRDEPLRSLLRSFGYRSWLDLPTGAIVGTVRLVSCVKIEETSRLWKDEDDWPDYRQGQWIWELTEPLPLPEPILMRGRLGVFEVACA